MKVMTVSLSPDPSPASGEGRFVSRIRDFHIKTSTGIFSMASVNKILLVGNLGTDPETRQMPNGDAVANLRVAESECR